MIVYTIILIVAGVIILILSVLTTVAIQDSNRQARYYEAEKSTTKMLRDNIKTLQAENGKLQQENAALNARNTALVEAMEARPTQPKRTVRKNSTQATEQEKEKGTS